MEYEDPFHESECQVELLSDLVDQIILKAELADRYYEMAIDLRLAAQKTIAKSGTTMSDQDMVSHLSMWYGSGYLIQILGEFGLCKHEMIRFECGICSKNVLFKREE
jgi:hypothetical protein